jgi:hypothetical protein
VTQWLVEEAAHAALMAQEASWATEARGEADAKAEQMRLEAQARAVLDQAKR